VITTTFTSCKKDDTTPITSQTIQDYNNYILDGDAAKTKITKLQADFKDINSRSRDASANIPLAEAVWNIEAVSNATYGHANFKRKILKVFKDTVEITTSLENGVKVVSSLVQAQKYSQVVDSILSKENSFNYPVNKRSLIFTDINAVNTSNGSLKLEIVIGIGLDPCPGCPSLDDAVVYTPTCTVSDSWWWGFKFGKCPTIGPFIVGKTDATDIIESLINNTIYGGLPCICFGDYYNVSNNTDDYYILNITPSPYFSPNANININYNSNTQPPYYQYLLFLSDNGGTCLSPTNIDFFRSGVDYIIHNDKIKNPLEDRWKNGKLFLNCDLDYNFIPGGNGYLHSLVFNTANFIKR
jgi:hypothetical protein